MTRPYLARSVHGREEPLAALGAALEGTGPRMVALIGEAGIGKSRLAGWAAERARETGRIVVEGRAVLGFSEAVGVMGDAVRTARRDGLSPSARDVAAAAFPAMVLPELGGGAGPESLGAVYEGAAAYLRALTPPKGLLLVLEDLHWADPASLRLVPFLARTLAPDRVTMVVTSRPDDGSAPLLGEMRDALARAASAQEIPLGPLGPEAATAMLADVLGGPPPAAVEAELLRLAGGNPFGLEELARAAVESGWIDSRAGSERSLDLPFTLTDAIRSRAAALDAPDRELIAWAAVLGERFDARALAALTGDDAREGLARLAGAGMVAPDLTDATGNEFGFRHALVWEVLAGEGLMARRRARHARVLTVADEVAAAGAPMSAAELAAHAFAAGDGPATIAFSREAADHAVQLGASLEAVAHFERALSVWPTDRDRAERARLLRECGRLRSRASRSDEHALPALGEALAEFAALGDDDEAAWTLALIANARFEVGERDGPFHDWDRALAVLRTEPGPALRSALVGQARALALTGRRHEALLAADEGLRVPCDGSGPEAAFDRINLLITRGMVMLLGGDPAGRADVENALGLADAMHDDLGAARAHHILGASWTDDVASAVHHMASARELVARHGMLLPQAFYSALHGYLLALHGEWDAAESRVDETAHLLARVGGDEWTTYNLIDARGRIALGRGDLDTAVRHFGDLVGAEDSMKDLEDEADAYNALATALLCSGRTGELDGPIVQGQRILPRLSGEVSLRTIVVGVEAHLAAGRLAQARELAAATRDDRMRPYLADAARALADLDDGAVEAAAAMADRAGARLEGAILRVGAAIVMAVYPEHRPGAARLARSAHTRFRELGSEAWCRRLEGMLRTLGERAPTPHGAGAGGLSARELEVLRLVAEGLTNRQIAERLQVTQHTAIRHVANIMAKLGARSRAAAVRIAAERGILRVGESA